MLSTVAVALSTKLPALSNLTHALSPIRSFHCSSPLCELRMRTRVRIVDNSEIGKLAMASGRKPLVIHVYKANSAKGVKAKATVGDKVLVTVHGEMKKAIVVGVRRHQTHGIPRSDSNDVVLVDDNGTPLGTRITVPLPMLLRGILKAKSVGKGVDYTKVLSIASRFI